MQRPTKMLWYGKHGTGKTRALATFRVPTLILDFDEGCRTIQGVPWVTVEDWFLRDRKKAIPFILKLDQRIAELQKNCPFEVVALDSQTFANSAIQGMLISQNSRWGQHPEFRLEDWQTLIGRIDILWRDLFEIPCRYVVITSHEMINISDETKSVVYLPVTEAGKKFPQGCARYFDEIWRFNFDAIGPKGELEYWIQTRPTDSKWTARSRYTAYNPDKRSVENILEATEPPDVQEILAKVTAAEGRSEKKV